MESKERRVASIKDRYLTFELDDELYGVEILGVKEIIGYQKTVHVPRMPDYVKGVMNLRGQIIPVIDLRTKLQMETVEPTDENAIIILIINNVYIGFVVDRVKDVTAISKDEISESPSFGSKIDTNFIKHMANLKEGVVMILNIESIFETDEINALGDIAQDDKTLKETE